MHCFQNLLTQGFFFFQLNLVVCGSSEHWPGSQDPWVPEPAQPLRGCGQVPPAI